MHHFLIRAIGSPTESWQSEALASYLKRLSPFAKIEMIELKEGHHGSAKPDQIRTKAVEGSELLQRIPKGAVIIALDEAGKNFSSMDFSRELAKWSDSGRSVVFLLGGSWGLDESVRNQADLLLSFGRETVPHILARILLLEQLYRAETILIGKTYHK
ncbi:MAG TPA: 23S rRNA (pseudouridine(1915)-N(3))-methyltransferase RlmH [Patescibacteria group bacterium]|nr:23S rRNA (pseudouridine(1915)-N(3))-methyltransferase RlmH [Patescibacteria group bacterium]